MIGGTIQEDEEYLVQRGLDSKNDLGNLALILFFNLHILNHPFMTSQLRHFDGWKDGNYNTLQ